MGRILKWFFYIFFAYFLLMFMLAIGVMLIVNPNNFKPQIIQKVKEATGRPFMINGDLRWTFFPLFGLAVNDVSLGKPSTSGPGDFLSFKKAEVAIALEPLMQGDIRISGFDITDGKIMFDDQANHPQTVLEHINVHSTTMAINQPFPLTLDADLKMATLPKPVPIKLTTRMTYRADQQQLLLDALTVNSNNLTLLGQLVINQLATTPVVTGNIEIPAFNAKQWLANVGKPLTFDALTNIAARFNVQTNKQTIQIKNLQAQLDDSAVTGNLLIDQQTIQPHWQINSNFTHVDINALTQSLKKIGPLHITGNGNVSANLTAVGNTLPTFLQTLNGNGKFSIQHGVLHGIDIPYYSNLADALANKTQPTRPNTQQTPFGNLTGTFQITNGIVNNRDLLLQAPQLTATGQGSANLNTQQINYTLQVQRLTSGTIAKARGPAIPILITGPFVKPDIRPDWQTLVVNEAKKQFKEHINNQLQSRLQSLLGQ